MLRPVLLFAAAIAISTQAEAAQPATATTDTFTLERGTIEGAAFEIAVPAKWNRHVLLIAHGYVPDDRPLIVDFAPRQSAYRALIDEGWIVAKTSYRRNGMIVADAIADIHSLRQQIEKQHGKPDRVLVLGESMGGLIVTLIAERDSTYYAGALAFGAALKIDEPGANITPNGSPKIPLLYVSNQSELAGPAAYVKRSANTTNRDAAPALFRLSRDGHVNVNQAERLASIRALNAWVEHGRSVLPGAKAGAPIHDATIAPLAQASKVVHIAGQPGFTTHVTAVSAAYGNVTLDAQPTDLTDAGIRSQSWFEISAHGKTYATFYGSDFSSVKVGEWVMFPDADGFFTLSKNYADAAGSAQLKEGDAVTIQPAAKPTN